MDHILLYLTSRYIYTPYTYAISTQTFIENKYDLYSLIFKWYEHTYLNIMINLEAQKFFKYGAVTRIEKYMINSSIHILNQMLFFCTNFIINSHCLRKIIFLFEFYHFFIFIFTLISAIRNLFLAFYHAMFYFEFVTGNDDLMSVYKNYLCTQSEI